MPRPVEARLQALERALGTGQTDWAAMQREKDIEFCRSVLALYLNVPDPHNHPELCKQVARVLEPINPQFAECIRAAMSENKTFRQLVADESDSELTALFEQLAASAKELPEGLRQLTEKMGRHATIEGAEWDPERASLAELFAVALGYPKQVQPETLA